MKRITGKVKKKKNINISKKSLFLIMIIVVIISFLIVSSLFNVKNIDVVMLSDKIENERDNGDVEEKANESKLTEETIKSIAGVSIGENFLKKSKKEIIENIKKNPYVEDVQISKKLDGTLLINVIEREVAYIINYAGAYIYIDDQGYVLELSSDVKDVPILLGVTTDFTSLAVGDSEKKVTRLNEDDLEKLTVVNSIMDSCRSNSVDSVISRIDISNIRNYILYLDSESKTVYLGNCKDLNTRILYMKEIIKQEVGHTGEIFIDGDLNTSYVYFKESI